VHTLWFLCKEEIGQWPPFVHFVSIVDSFDEDSNSSPMLNSYGDSIKCLSPLDPNDYLMARSYFFRILCHGFVWYFSRPRCTFGCWTLFKLESSLNLQTKSTILKPYCKLIIWHVTCILGVQEHKVTSYNHSNYFKSDVFQYCPKLSSFVMEGEILISSLISEQLFFLQDLLWHCDTSSSF